MIPLMQTYRTDLRLLREAGYETRWIYRGQFEWFLGEVLTVNDPEFMNRVQVRCFGFYSDNIETANIPWATVMNPSTSGSYKGWALTITSR